MKGTMITELFCEVPELEFHIGYQYFLGNMDNYNKALMSILKSIKSKLPLLQMMCSTQEYEGLRSITQTLRRLLDKVGAISISERTYLLELILLNEDEVAIHKQVTDYRTLLLDFSVRLEKLIKKIDANKAEIEKEELAYNRFNYLKTMDRIMKSV